MNDWLQKEKERETLAASLREGNKAVLFDALQKAGISAVHVDFDGCDDSGQIEGVTAMSGSLTVELPEDDIELAQADWDNPEPVRKSFRIREAIEELAYGFLEREHDGWEIDGGGSGEFIFDVTARTVTLTFNARYVDVHTSEHSF
jgi:hypothetical protein